MKAVILAGGMGTRIREHHVLPKGFITIDKKPIIEESLQILQNAGIKNILIVTGYEATHYEKLATQYEGVETTFNKEYSTGASLSSLYYAKDWVDEDIVVLESDLIYESSAIKKILDALEENIILVSGETNSGDEVYVEAHNQQLINMSKNPAELNKENILGEFVGINKLSLASYRALISLCDENPALIRKGHYETNGLVTLSKTQPIHCLKLQDLLWCEIDNFAHLERAKKIYKEMRNQHVQ